MKAKSSSRGMSFLRPGCSVCRLARSLVAEGGDGLVEPAGVVVLLVLDRERGGRFVLLRAATYAPDRYR